MKKLFQFKSMGFLSKKLRKIILFVCIGIVGVVIMKTQTLKKGDKKVSAVDKPKEKLNEQHNKFLKTLEDKLQSSWSKQESSRSRLQNSSTTLLTTRATSPEDKTILRENTTHTSSIITAKTTKVPTKKTKVPTKKTKKMFTSEEAKAIRRDVLDWFTIKNDSLKDDRLNRHNYIFTLNSKLCTRKHIPLLIVVHSSVQYISKRQRIRDTWSSVANRTYAPVVVFMLGQESPSSKPSLQKNIELESQKYGDIVQGDFIDSYKNLTYKHVMAIHWMTSHCDDVRTIVKLDDDVFVDVYKLGNFSQNTGYIRNSLYCHVFKMERPKREGKWELSMEEFPFDLFPKCCEGMVYVMSMDVAKKLKKASETMKFIWIDDLYVTGILALKAGVTHTPFAFRHRPLKDGWVTGRFTSLHFTNYMFFVHFKDWSPLMKKIYGVNDTTLTQFA